MKRITIRDLAKMLHLSPSTVSRALSDHPDISEQTKDRVKETAAKFNYSVNLQSSFFRNKKSNLIALIIPDINMFYIPSMINAINDLLYSTEYSLFVFLTKDKLKREKKIVEQCIMWAVEGVLISPSLETSNLEHLEPLKMSGIKTVVLDKVLRDSEFPSVSIDNVNAACTAVDYLLSRGHRNILGIFGNPNLSITKERVTGFIKAHENHDLIFDPDNIIKSYTTNELDSILPVVLNHNKAITAIFSMSDELLAKVYFHLMKLSIKIPEDISLISISDGYFPQLTFPKTSCIKDSGRKMGKRACELLIEQIAYNKTDYKHIEIATKLVELNSVKSI